MPLRVDVEGNAQPDWVCAKCTVACFDDESTAADHEIHCGETLFHNNTRFVPELLHENVTRLAGMDMSLRALKISRGFNAQLYQAMDDLVQRFLQRNSDYDEDDLAEIDAYYLDGYSKLGGWIARLSSIEVFVIADEDRFDRGGSIQDLYEQISDSKSIEFLKYVNCVMRDDYGLGALPTESLVRITMDDCVLSNKCLSGEIDECEKLKSIEFKDCEIVFEDCRLLESIFALIDVFKTMESLEEVIFQDCTIREGDNEHSFNYKRKVIKSKTITSNDNCLCDREKLNSIEFRHCDFVDGCHCVFEFIDTFKTIESLEEVVFKDCTIQQEDQQYSFKYEKKSINSKIVSLLMEMNVKERPT
jgi:hypothetical protein